MQTQQQMRMQSRQQLSSPSSPSSPPTNHPPSASSPPTYSQLAPLPPMHQLPGPSSATDRLPPLTHHDPDNKMLPSLSTIAADFAMRGDPALERRRRRHPPPPPAHWLPFNASAQPNPPLATYRLPPYPSPDSPATAADMDGAASPSLEGPYDGTPTPSSLTLDDPDVRLAAEALGDLRADFVSASPDSASIPPMSPPAPPFRQLQARAANPTAPNSEPLLSLLTTAHPLVASTIGGASSAYGGAKNFSPRFKSGAEYVEGYVTPIANTINSVGRATGVEGGVRWFLGAGRRHPAPPTSDPDSAGNSKKRRKMDENGNADGSPEISAWDDSSSLMSAKTPRRLSSASTVDTLPAYDDQRSPAYTEIAAASSGPPSTAPWQTRLIMSTSGLSVAMSEESLRSLKYCLRWLRWANGHMNAIIVSLKNAVEEYEKAEKVEAAPSATHSRDQEMEVDSEPDRERALQQSRTEIAARINNLKGDVLKTLQDVINNVSKYAGGALPENARVLVRRHLTSLPQRFRLATINEPPADHGDKDGDSALREGAQKVLVLAKEGLDMVTQVTGVLDGTIVTAENWCERMGKRRRADKDDEESTAQPSTERNGDVKLG